MHFFQRLQVQAQLSCSLASTVNKKKGVVVVVVVVVELIGILKYHK
jgi:hypothetical protein